jgi:hypothetical protein
MFSWGNTSTTNNQQKRRRDSSDVGISRNEYNASQSHSQSSNQPQPSPGKVFKREKKKKTPTLQINVSQYKRMSLCSLKLTSFFFFSLRSLPFHFSALFSSCPLSVFFLTGRHLSNRYQFRIEEKKKSIDATQQFNSRFKKKYERIKHSLRQPSRHAKESAPRHSERDLGDGAERLRHLRQTLKNHLPKKRYKKKTFSFFFFFLKS